MKRKANTTLVFLFLVVLGVPIGAQAQSGPAQQTLQEYVTDLKRNPNDTVLREKIIRFAQTMNPAPAIPEGAREHYVMAVTFVEAAKDNSGYERAIEQYKAALSVAPWWVEVYKKLAIVQKAAAHYDDAISSLSMYLVAQPADARDAQDEIYKLKALKQTAEDQVKTQAASARQAAPAPNSFEALLKKIDGRRYTCPQIDNQGASYLLVIDVRGATFLYGSIARFNSGGGYSEAARDEIRGRETTVPIRDHPALFPVWAVSRSYWISEDGDRITLHVRYSDGDVRDYIFLWQK
jgi:tetratricopeptide (TPR) repeat protein